MMALEKEPQLVLTREEILGNSFNPEFSAALSSFLDRATALDFSRLILLMQSRKIHEPEARRVMMVELTRFIALALLFREEETPLSPPLLIHTVWQLFILFVNDYHHLCGDSIDSLVPHDPLSLLAPSEYVVGYALTLSKYSAVFGVEVGVAGDDHRHGARAFIWPSVQLLEAALSRSLALGRWSYAVNGEAKASWMCLTCAFINVRAVHCSVCGSGKWRAR